MARGIVFSGRMLSAGPRRSLQQLRNLGENPTGLLETWGDLLEASTRERFDTGRGPGGVPWPPSKRVLRAGGGKTLVDHANLEGSIRSEVRARTTLLVGVDGRSESAKHAASHQFGVNKGVVVVTHFRVVTEAFGVPLAAPRQARVRGHVRHMRIPRRPFLGVDSADMSEMRDAGVRYLKRVLGL